MQKQYDFIIIGAGISGLSQLHYYHQQGFNCLLLEKQTDTGGCLHSHHFKQCDNFWLEMGTHSCFNSYGQLLNILNDCSLTDKILAKKSTMFKMWSQQRQRSIVSQLHFFNLLRHIPRLFFSNKKNKSVRDYYQNIFGKNNYQQVFRPAFSAVACQNVDDIPADVLFKKKSRNKKIAKNFTFAAGQQTISNTLTEKYQQQIQTNTVVEKIERHQQGYKITQQYQEKSTVLHCKKLILATPVNVSRDYLKNLHPQLSQLLSKINHVKIETVAVCLPQQELNFKPLAGIIAQDDKEIFYSAVSRDPIEDPQYRGFTFHFKPLHLTLEQKLNKIAEVLAVDVKTLTQVAEKTNVLPSPQTHHTELLSQIDKNLKNKNLGLCGNYFKGFSVEDCLLRSKIEYQRLSQ